MAGTALYALNGFNGATVWGPIEIGTYPNIAYESGRVVAINRDGLLRGFDATTGTQVWSRQLLGQSFSSPPTAVGGTVYVNGFSTLYAVSGLDGTVKWSVPLLGSEHSSPAVTATGSLFDQRRRGVCFCTIYRQLNLAYHVVVHWIIWKNAGFLQ